MLEAKRAEETKKERKLEREVMLEAPVDEVWKALTDAKELKKWFALDARVTRGAGGKSFCPGDPAVKVKRRSSRGSRENALHGQSNLR